MVYAPGLRFKLSHKHTTFKPIPSLRVEQENVIPAHDDERCAYVGARAEMDLGG